MSILSIQSSVAYGHVGNAAAVFPLQRLGFEVWPVNTVLFSNHPGYGDWRGRVLDAIEVADVVQGVKARGVFDQCQAVLSGYLGSADIARVVLETAAAIKTANSDALFCCDPVMGDREEGLYVPVELAALFRTALVGAADMVIPNAFELSYLLERPVENSDEALRAADAVISMGPSMVVVTSLVPSAAPGTLEVLAVSKTEAWRVTTPRLETMVKGSGDAFSALFLGRYLASLSMRDALVDAVSSVFALIEASHAVNSRELMMVAAQDEIVAPRRRFAAEAMR